MAVRICTMNVDNFQHDGLVVGKTWAAVPPDIAEPARAALVKYEGRFVRVHPNDVKNLHELGLGVKDGKVVDLRAEMKKTPKNPAGKVEGKKD